MFSGSLRIRLALLYGGVFLVLAVVVLAIPFLAVSESTHVGSVGAPVVQHPGRSLLPQVIVAVITLAIAVALSLGLGWLLAGRLLRPLRAIIATARDISATNLSRRLRTGERDDEFSRLGQTLNDLFARLEASFESQRHFVANAAHELRTPLTAERTVLQVALRDPDASVASLRAACDEVLQLGEQQERLIDALLTLAGSERGIARPEPFDLAELAASAVKGVAIVDGGLGRARAEGDPRLAESLVANLVGNAVKHNVPGGWASIETRTETDPETGRGRPVLRVCNSGPVIPPGEVDRLFQPFQRLGDERVRQARQDGHGLGLAIVRAIAVAHGAELTARARPEGGLDITVRFPPPGVRR
ncbi:MAG TPA: HAMP domain-containing sensor histidine kinase [Trebonia sp.]|nr:HAMP domain-containing sensor histidine kinase [Trebonia sp.]